MKLNKIKKLELKQYQSGMSADKNKLNSLANVYNEALSDISKNKSRQASYENNIFNTTSMTNQGSMRSSVASAEAIDRTAVTSAAAVASNCRSQYLAYSQAAESLENK